MVNYVLFIFATKTRNRRLNRISYYSDAHHVIRKIPLVVWASDIPFVPHIVKHTANFLLCCFRVLFVDCQHTGHGRKS